VPGEYEERQRRGRCGHGEGQTWRVARDLDELEGVDGGSAHPPSTYGYALQLMGGWGWTSRSFAANIKQPTLIISGDDDPLVPLQNARDLQEAIPSSVLRVVSGGGHLLLLDEPQKTARIIRTFLEPLHECTPDG